MNDQHTLTFFQKRPLQRKIRRYVTDTAIDMRLIRRLRKLGMGEAEIAKSMGISEQSPLLVSTR